jgi:hypothetical protein
MAYKQKSTVKSLCSGSMAKMNADLEYDPINDDADSPVPMYGSKKPALPNLKSGGKMISSDKGSSNYMKEDTGSAILQGGRKRVGEKVGGSVASAGTNPPKSSSAIGKGNTFFSDQSKLMSDPTKTNTQINNRAGDVVDQRTGLINSGATNRRDMGITDKSKSNYNSMFQDGDGGSNTTAVEALSGSGTTPKAKKTTAKKVTKKVPEEVKGPSAAQTAAQTAASKLERRAKTAISKQKRKPKTEDGVNAVRDFQANKKKKGKEMSRGEIKEAKKKDKDSGMSRKEVRLNKTKRKAASTRAKTVSKETAAKGGKEAQRLARKTIRLEKKAAKIEGRVKASKIK